MRRYRRAVAAGVAIALLAAGCTNNGGSSGGDQPQRPINQVSERLTDHPSPNEHQWGQGVDTYPAATDFQISQYGEAPTPHPDVTYAEDVVMVGGGAAAVRGLAADGLTWLIDPAAPRVEQLAVGKVMFLTGNVVGRVLALQARGSDLAVLLGPVNITEVVTNANLAIEGFALDAVPAYVSVGEPFWDACELLTPPPDSPSAPPDECDPATLPPLPTEFGTAPEPLPETTKVPQPSSDPEPLAPGGPPIDELRPVEVGTLCCADGVGTDFFIDGGGVKAEGTVKLKMSKPTLGFVLDISGGEVKRAQLSISGGMGLHMQFAAGTDNGSNLRRTFRVPVDARFPLGSVLGIPLTATLTQSVTLKTSFNDKLGNIKAVGDWDFNRTLNFGYTNGSFGLDMVDSITVNTSLIDNVTGYNHALLAGGSTLYDVKLTVGIGAFGFTAGVYIGLSAKVLAMTTSAIVPHVSCRVGELDLNVTYGIGYSIPPLAGKIINAFLSIINVSPIALENTIGDSANLLRKRAIAPEIDLCMHLK